MKKLLLIMPELFWGGAERQFRYLISELQDNAVVCISHSNSKKSTWTQEELQFQNEHPRTVFLTAQYRSQSRLKRLFALKKIISQAINIHGAQCALVYHGDGCYMIPYLRLRGVPVIYSERNSGEGVIESRLIKYFVRWSNHLTANSERAAEVIQDYFHMPVKCIHNGIDCANTFRPRTAECSEMLVPARIAPVKNQKLILAFFHDHPEFQGAVRFAGKSEDPAYEEELRQTVKKYGLEHRVSFLGFQENMDTLYQTDCFVVLPSYHEGMSNVILECFARGIPIFVSSIPENRFTEYLQEFSFAPDDSEGLAKCIAKWDQLTVPERNAILDANYAYVSEEHSIQKMVNEYKQFLIS